MAELVEELEETLFTAVLQHDNHVLRYVLPDRRDIHTLLDQDVVNSRWLLGAILGTLAKDFCFALNVPTMWLTHHHGS